MNSDCQDKQTASPIEFKLDRQTQEALAELTYKINLIFDMLSEVLVEASYLTKVQGLSKNTISQNKKLEKFNEIGKRKLLLKLESVPVIKARKRKK